MNIKIISAGAGSGKTYRLTQEMVRLMREGVRASGIIATTFTKKAAAELQERVRVKLLSEGLNEQAEDLTNALVGTVHSLGVKLLQRFAYEAGISPEVAIIAEEDQQILFNQSLATVLTDERVEKMTLLCDRLGLSSNEYFDWRREVRQITEVARANDFSREVLERSRERSFESFRVFLGEPAKKSAEAFNAELSEMLKCSIERLESNADETQVTKNVVKDLVELERELRLRGELSWRNWAKISKLKPGAKSKDDVADLLEFAKVHEQHPQFQQDIQAFIDQVFELALAALDEFAAYKKQRGLIDYTDMEALIMDLLRDEQVQTVLRNELDLLLVDEFQDTSPMQLEIFLKLSQLARHSIWVGDPKQSIYGFRGAAPELMQAIIEQSGGVKPEDIQENSWRSRQDLVYASNAIFVKAFADMPPEQVALIPKRTKNEEAIEASDALVHWYFEEEEEEGKKRSGRTPGKPWPENCTAFALREWLQRKVYVLPKGEKSHRPAQPGDVAILCRSNTDCQNMAEALNRAGFKVAIARAGLLNTAEAKLVLACLKYLLNYHDSLSVAEILLLGAGKDIETIVEDRLDYLKNYDAGEITNRWATNDFLIRRLDELRTETIELSSAEILDLLVEDLDLRRRIVSWGKANQRLDNLDVLRKLALQYEEACNRLQSAASLGGLLLWLNELESEERDFQAAGESPEAINVMTYHRSKGLEWPIVICYNLEKDIRTELWGLNIEQEEGTQVDLNNILSNRWLRYWVNPYDKQFKGTPLAERLAQSEVQAKKIAQATQEENRLLYVGLTRARDYLIFPTTNTPTKWLNRAWHEGKDDYPTLDASVSDTPWEWAGVILNKETETFTFSRDFELLDIEESEILFLEPRAGKQKHIPLYIDTWKENLQDQIPSFNTGELMTYASAFHIESLLADFNQISRAVKAFFHAWQPDYDTNELKAITEGLLQRFEVEEWLSAEQLLPAGQAFRGFLDQYFQAPFYHQRYPLRHFHGVRIFEREIDLLLESEDGIALIQFSSYAGDMKRYRAKAAEMAPFLYFSKAGVQQIFQEENIRTFVHFVLNGAMVELYF
ncbi:UvrD-helicase domain-containing protein [Haliscomenobacter sp.]|uniref:UvrD-helicase domain-containing protein n=1 Tax=Haliscomenobacter sp. TaxID=2717303 RepID=UPI003BA8B795